MFTSLKLQRQHAIIAFVLFAGGLFAHAQVGLGLAPMRVELRMAPSTEHSGSLNLNNSSGTTTRIRAELLDFYLDETATPQFAREYKQEAQFSCRQWLSVNPMEGEVEKSGSIPVRYTMRVPPDAAEGSYHCAAGFTTMPAVDKSAGTGMVMAVRIVSAFYVVVGKPAIDGALKQIKLEAVEDGEHHAAGWQAVVTLENRGLMYFRPTGKLEIVDAKQNVVQSWEFQSNAVLPKRDQRFLFPIKIGLASEPYTLRARVDIGGGEIQEGSTVVSTSSTPQ